MRAWRVLLVAALCTVLGACGRDGFAFLTTQGADNVGGDDAGPSDGDPLTSSDDITTDDPSCTCTWPDTCGADNQCGHAPWFVLGDSVIADTGTRLEWGSAAGNGISPLDFATPIALAAMADGTPIVAWTTAWSIYTQVFSGGSWHGMSAQAPDLVTLGDAHAGTFTQLADGRLLLVVTGFLGAAWTSTARAYVLNGTAWSQLGANLWTPGQYSTVSAVSDASGDPILVYETKYSGSNVIYVKRYNGSAWVEFSTGSASTTGVSAGAPGWGCDIATGPAHQPCVSWLGNSGAELFARCWDGTTWAELNGSGSTGVHGASSDGVRFPQLVEPSDMQPIIAFSIGNNALVTRFDGSAWVPVGPAAGLFDASQPEGLSYPSGFDFTTTSSGQLLLALSLQDPQRVFATYFDGSSWQWMPGPGPIATPINPTEFGMMPLILALPANQALIAWADYSNGSNAVYARTWDGSAWITQSAPAQTAIGGISPAGVDGLAAQIVIKDDGTIDAIFAAGSLTDDRGSAAMRQYIIASNRWHDVPGPWDSFPTVPMSAPWFPPRLMYTSDGRPIVMAFNGTVTAPVFSEADDLAGTTWTQTDAPSFSAMSAIIDPQDRYLVCAQISGGAAVERYEAGSWNTLGAAFHGAAGSPSQCAFASGTDPLLVAWREATASSGTNVYVAQFDGSAWQGLAGSATGGGLSSYALGVNATAPEVRVSPTLGPIVAWIKADQHTAIQPICLARYDGSAWVDIGTGSRAGNAVAQQVSGFDMALDDAGMPILALSERGSAASTDIHVRRFDGTTWSEVPAAIGAGGVSNSNTAKRPPAIAIKDGLICVTWSEQDGVSMRAVARCFDGTP